MNEWEEKDKREVRALKAHARLSRLFRENRFAFERERKKMIEEVIEQAREDGLKARLRALQADWDKKMKGAGSAHNRFLLAETLFWTHFHEVWHPAIREASLALSPHTPQRPEKGS